MTKLSKTTKLPCPSWGIPTHACPLGALYSKKQGTVCNTCYAKKGRFVFPSNKEFLQKNLDDYLHNPKKWVVEMALLINSESPRYFRWFHSGDLIDSEMLKNICKVCRKTKDTLHWLPTLQINFVSKLRNKPSNLIIRVSTPMVDYIPSSKKFIRSYVYKKTKPGEESHDCPARFQDNTCGQCRSCWDPKVKIIAYPKK